MPKIDEFEGHDVVAAKVNLTKGSGFDIGLAVHLVNEEVSFVGRGTVRRVIMDTSKDNPDERVRVHVVWTEEVALVDGSAVESMLGAERDRLRLMREELDGVSHLNFDPDLLDQEDSPSEALIRENLGAP